MLTLPHDKKNCCIFFNWFLNLTISNDGIKNKKHEFKIHVSQVVIRHTEILYNNGYLSVSIASATTYLATYLPSIIIHISVIVGNNNSVNN